MKAVVSPDKRTVTISEFSDSETLELFLRSIQSGWGVVVRCETPVATSADFGDPSESLEGS